MGAIETKDPYLQLGAAEIKDLEEKYLFSTYKRYDAVLTHGSGAYLFDRSGRRYLDFLAGIAVNSLGYGHPRILKVLHEQGHRVMHCSNLFYNSYQGILAKRLADISGLSRAFFTNSGTEAIEGALKIARAYGHLRSPEKSGILALRNSFHGRTLGALSITAQPKYQAPFQPLIPGVRIVEELSAGALEEAFNDGICALVIEPIQGEGGVVPIPRTFLQAARDLCDRYDALLVFDEIQCGMGRTGKYFAYQHYGIVPDLVTIAKPIAAGYPLGAVLGSSRTAESLKPGEHGTTFGGGPLACRLALEVLDIIDDEGLLDRVTQRGSQLMRGLRNLSGKHSCIREVRGLGLMIGAEMGTAAKDVVQSLLKHGVLANAAHDSVLRLLPPFIVSEEQVDEFLGILDRCLGETENGRE
jgi:predicted acetylornithine/succinylornithine family transaminase